jgi:Glycosyltransferase family 87
MTPTSRIGALLALAALVWHVLSVLSPAWVTTFEQTQARDFASYYYAVEVGRAGGDPYSKAELNAAAREDGFRNGVHPFLYAPPFLLGMSWVSALALPDAFHLWFWLDELLAIASALVLWRWWRDLSPSSTWVIAVLFGLLNAIPNNHAMGQANFPGLVLALAGLWQTDKGRPWVGGALMGAACMMKMSPALFVVWWLVRREWRAALAAVIAAALLSVASLPWAGPVIQARFYTEVLPTFSNGGYNGLAVSIGMFGNHSIPNLFDQAAPTRANVLSPVAHLLSSAFAIGALATLSWLFRAPGPDAFRRAAQASAFGVLLLLIPVYTYEHHLIFALPAACIATLAVDSGRIRPGAAALVGIFVGILVFDLQYIRAIAETLPDPIAWLGGLFQELKTIALGGLFLTATFLGLPERAA